MNAVPALILKISSVYTAIHSGLGSGMVQTGDMALVRLALRGNLTSVWWDMGQMEEAF